MAKNTITLRRSPFVMLRQIIVLEIAIGILFLVPTLFQRIGLFTVATEHFFHSNLVLGIAGIILQIVVISLVFIRWYLTIYTINDSKIVVVQNFISRKEENYPLKKISSLTLAQNLFDKIFNTARLVAKDGRGNILFILKNISDPAYHLSLIEQKQTVREPEATVECENKPLKKIIKDGESQCVEFKSTLLWDKKRQEASKNIQFAIMKTISGFMNTQGGILLIGVDDNKKVVGLEDDLKNMKKKGLDGFENFFNLIFTNMIGLEFRNYIEVSFKKIDKKDICVIKVKASSKPVYLKEQKNESFYIRAGNATHPLRISEATRYIEENFKKKGK